MVARLTAVVMQTKEFEKASEQTSQSFKSQLFVVTVPFSMGFIWRQRGT